MDLGKQKSGTIIMAERQGFETPLEDEDEVAGRQASRTLGLLTDRTFGEDEEKWREWWEANKEQFRPFRGVK